MIHLYETKRENLKFVSEKSRKMTDLPPNSPIDIRALALYDIHQWKTTEKSYKNYKNLCEAMGNDAISYDEYESLFNEFLEESYYSTRDERFVLEFYWEK